MSKNEKIIKLTRNKTKQLTLMLNDELINLFKQACEKNEVKPTQMFELWMIDYIDKNGLI